MSDHLTPTISIDEYSFALPGEAGSSKGIAFGDLELLHNYNLVGIEDLYRPECFAAAVEPLVDDGDILHTTEEDTPVIAHNGNVIKYCWEGGSLEEAYITEAMRIGLARTALETGHGIIVPRVIAGIDFGGAGLLITEYMKDFLPVSLFPTPSQGQFSERADQRETIYRDALKAVGLDYDERAWDLEIGFDDSVTNTLWPRAFNPYRSVEPVPATSVRVDLSVIGREFSQTVVWPTAV